MGVRTSNLRYPFIPVYMYPVNYKNGASILEVQKLTP
jgi:hypothetical protein